jgi:hypothetical protein
LSAAVSMNANHLRNFGVLPVGTTNSVQPTLGSFNADSLEPNDYLLARCAALGIRVIIPLVDNYQYFSNGKFWYCTANGVTPDGSASQFFSNSTVINSFKAFISFVLNHRNPYTGLKYKDDPTVLAWETINEGENGTGQIANSTYVNWTGSISQYIKVTESAQQLVVDGKYGLTPDGGGTYDTASLALPYVDIYTDHAYTNYNTPAILAGEGAACHNADKAFYVGEFTWTGSGFNPQPQWTLAQMLSTIEGSANIDGDAYWRLFPQLDTHGGGFVLHYPGDTTDMATRVGQLSTHASTMS